MFGGVIFYSYLCKVKLKQGKNMTRDKYLKLLFAHQIVVWHTICGNFFNYEGETYWVDELK